MAKLCLTLLFSISSLAGLGLILYAAFTPPRRSCECAPEMTETLGFADSEQGGAGVLDLDIGHEGLTHKGKEAFDPEKHKPEPIETRKKI